MSTSSATRAKFGEAGFDPHLVPIPASTEDPWLKDLEIYAVRRKAATPGGKEPLLLLHGHPQNMLIWHRVVTRMGEAFSKNGALDRDVVVADLRGHGNSGAPRVRNFVRQGHGTAQGDEKDMPSEEALRQRYSKRAMARDMVCVMKHLGYERFAVCGHDRGGRVSHRMAIDYPDVVTRVMTLDIVPTYDLYDRTNSFFASAYWHWFFLIQPYPVPEEMILGSPKTYLDKMTGRSLSGGGVTSSKDELFPPDVMTSYLKQLSSPPRVHATCEDYRCSGPGGIDLELDEQDRKNGIKIKQPLRALLGSRNIHDKLFGGEEGCLSLWRNVCAGEVSLRFYDCGHYMPEEVDKDIVDEILTYF